MSRMNLIVQTKNHPFRDDFLISPGSELLFQVLADQVSSPLKGLTSEFEMESGVSPSLEPPG